MKRRYTAADYRATVARVRTAVPAISLSSDFIVGFPGESEEDFEQTLALVREIRFGSLFGFRYSPRPGTAAARWGRDTEVAEPVAVARLARLLDLQGDLQRETNEGLEGRQFEILVEGEDKHGLSKGRTPCNRIVHVEDGAGSLRAGEYATVTVVRGLPNSLIGRLCA
jgi:tRNA-2-methylthio-N6-dimethylallyladenosine synthase